MRGAHLRGAPTHNKSGDNDDNGAEAGQAIRPFNSSMPPVARVAGLGNKVPVPDPVTHRSLCSLTDHDGRGGFRFHTERRGALLLAT
jgi:hypothetical protein